jgi:hypothetical protein
LEELFERDIGCDMMMPEASSNANLSKVTVAMINDFGWYQIDFEKLNDRIREFFNAIRQ